MLAGKAFWEENVLSGKNCWQEDVHPEKSTRKQSSCASGMSETDSIREVRDSVRYSRTEWHRSAAFGCSRAELLLRIKSSEARTIRSRVNGPVRLKSETGPKYQSTSNIMMALRKALTEES